MGAIDTLLRWFDPAAGRPAVYRCAECDATLVSHDDACPDCGGEVAVAEGTIEYRYWSPYQ